MSSITYEPVIGLEVHVQLQTESKAFSPESAAFGADSNAHIDPVSLGHPGTLPVLNDRVVGYTLRLGLACHCNIAPRSVFARKHYFYPDLPKGYQISQYETPICEGGYVEITDGKTGETRRIGLTRIHMEEDAGKSVHDQDPYATLLDYNRCGVPLMELVTEPEIRSPREAYLFLQKMRQLVRYLGVSDGNMEEGSLRCDANISVRPVGETRLGTKTELKNMNSFRHVEQALTFEIARQIEILENGGTIQQVTLLWDTARGETRPMRGKEEAHDYRYFPDPDLIPVLVEEKRMAEVQAALPELPDALFERFTTSLGLPAYDAAILTEDREVAAYFDAVLRAWCSGDAEQNLQVKAKAVSNVVMTDVLRELSERNLSAGSFPIEPERLAALLEMRLQNQINSSAQTALFMAMLERPDAPEALAEELNLLQVSDSGSLLPVIDQVIENNPAQLKQYLDGKESVIGFFIGQVMKAFPGSPDPKLVRVMLLEALNLRKN